MGTLAELKARILDELPSGAPVSVRQIGQHITRAIEAHGRERFFFSIGTGTTVTVAGQSSVTAPLGLQHEDLVQVQLGAGTAYPLEKLSRAEIDELRITNSPAAGQPETYSWRSGEELVFWPTPNAIYSVYVTGVFAQLPLAADADANAWTTTGADLIAATAKKTIFRDLVGDVDRFNAAQLAENEALYRLRSETINRLSDNRMRGSL